MTRFHFGNSLDSNITYLLSYSGLITDPFFFLEIDDIQTIFLSPIDIDAFRSHSASNVEAINVKEFFSGPSVSQSNASSLLGAKILNHYKVNEKILVPENFPIKIADDLRKQNFVLETDKDWCKNRRVKKTNEIDKIEKNFPGVKSAYQMIEQILSESEIHGSELLYNGDNLTSEYLKKEVSKIFIDYNLACPEGMIISSAEQSSYPHHEGEGNIKANTSIIVDLFPRHVYTHYFTDMTRTYVKGSPDDVLCRMHKAVLESKEESIKMLKPGVKASAVYKKSASVILDFGFDVGEIGYIHSLGHGVGIDIHESPKLSPSSEDRLEVGHVLTIEPGLYYKKHGGVRLEDTLVITKDGYRNLTDYKNEWIIK